MAGRGGLRPFSGAVVFAAALGLAGAPPALAAQSPEAIKQQIEKSYPVQVLEILEVKSDSQPAYAVVVMNTGGNFNEAFQVNTLVVDAETGQLIRQFRHGASGYEVPENAVRRWPKNDTGDLRRETR